MKLINTTKEPIMKQSLYQHGTPPKDNKERRYTADEYNKLQDLFQVYNLGKIQIECFMLDGEIHGEYKKYYKHGGLMKHAIYKNSHVLVDLMDLDKQSQLQMKQDLLKENPDLQYFTEEKK